MAIDSKDLIRKIHTSNTKIVLAVVGGGSEVIGELLRHGGGSATVLDAQVPYSQRAFEQYIGGRPDKFVSEDAACQLAMASFQRCKYLDPSAENPIGVGATCALVKDKERQGRDHIIWVATQRSDKSVTCGFRILSNEIRETEEAIVADAILHELAGVALEEKPQWPGTRWDCSTITPPIGGVYSLSEPLRNIFTGSQRYAALGDSTNTGYRLVFPGSFNPIHEGHLKMAEIARRVWPKVWQAEVFNNDKVDFEISVANVEKPLLSYKSVLQRIDYFRGAKTIQANENLGELWFTKAAKFYEKAMLFPFSTFIVGMDTLIRLCDKKCYTNDQEYEQAIASFESLGIHWIVFPRSGVRFDPQTVDPRIIKHSLIVSETEFDTGCYNQSSRNIRKEAE